jgi:hypothetical protein
MSKALWTVAGLATLVAVLAVIALLDVEPRARVATAGAACRELLTTTERTAARSPRLGRSSSRAGRAPVPFDARTGRIADRAVLTFPFGRSREPMVRRQAFAVPEDMRRNLVTIAAPFADLATTEGRPIPNVQVSGYITRRGPGRTVLAAVCVNPAAPQRVPAGTYTGTAKVGVGERLKTMNLTVRVGAGAGKDEATATPDGVG